MLKIYQAIGNQTKVEIKKGITFEQGRFNTGIRGYGQIRAGRSCEKADYALDSLEGTISYFKSVEMNDGYVDNFIIFSPLSEEALNNAISQVQKTENDFKNFGFNEEAILLFTNWVNVQHDVNAKEVKRYLGRTLETGCYLLLPGAQFQMGFPNCDLQSYEVLQSKTLGKQLHLVKLDRQDSI